MPLTERETESIFRKLDTLDERLDGLDKAVSSHVAWEEGYHPEHKALLERILDQTTKTNGRVSQLELWKENLTGKMAGIAIVISAIIGLVFKIL